MEAHHSVCKEGIGFEISPSFEVHTKGYLIMRHLFFAFHNDTNKLGINT